MIGPDPVIIGGAILMAGWVIAKAIEETGKRIADRIDNCSHSANRIGTKLDNLWSPLKGINTVLWRRSGISPELVDTLIDNEVEP